VAASDKSSYQSDNSAVEILLDDADAEGTIVNVASV